MIRARIEVIGQRFRGASKAGARKLLGDAKLVADGAAEQAAGAAESALARAEGPPIGMDPDRIVGIGHRLRGALKQGVGKLVGDQAIEAVGGAELASGKRQREAGSIRDELRDVTESADIRSKP
jgi:uncharacterized protein YjbJ (UPF0337 family)